MMHIKSKKIFVALSFVLAGCATKHYNPNIPLTDEASYFDALEKSTKKKQIYDGFQASLEFSTTLLSTSVQKYQLDHKARIYQWNSEKYNEEKSKIESDLTKQTEVFLSFYIPDRKSDDLNKKTTLWKVFLDSNGRRYEGKIEKIKTQFAEIIALYPHHNRWSTPYKIIFNIPISMVETSSSKLTITGPVGSASADFIF